MGRKDTSSCFVYIRSLPALSISLSLYLPRMRVDLTELDLVGGYGLAIAVKDQEAGAGGALVDGAHEDLRGLHSESTVYAGIKQ